MSSYIFLIVLLFLFSINPSALYAQGIDCASAEPFCTDGGTTFSAGLSNGNFAASGNDYDCLTTQPNGAWYYLEVSSGGNLNIDLTSNPPQDIDFIIWGPFSNIANAQSQCGSLNSVVDCSFNPATSETVNIQGASNGEVYILLITNYSDLATDISAQSANNNNMASTNCDIVVNPPCDVSAGTVITSTTGGGSGNSLVVCDGESASLFSNDDYTLPPPETGEESELMYAIYNCAPSGNNPDTDPCFSGLFWTSEDFDAATAGAFATNNGGFPQAYLDAGITGDGNGTVWYVPITMDDSDEGGNPNGLINFDQNGDDCYILGSAISISFPDIPSVQTISDCNPVNGMGSIEVTVNGNGSFTINETGAGNVQGNPGSVSNGDVFTITGLSDGDTWSFSLNAGGCQTDFSGFFSCSDDICLVDGGITANPPASAFPGGLYPPGETVTFCVDIGQYNQSNVNFLHGIVPSFGNGWTNPQSVSAPMVAANNEIGSSWDWLPPGSVQENVSGASINEFGWWFFSISSPGGIPSDTNDSWGDGCSAIFYPTDQATCELTSFGEYLPGLGCHGNPASGFDLWVGPDNNADIIDPAMNQTVCESLAGTWDNGGNICLFPVETCFGNASDGFDLSWEACFTLTTVSEAACASGNNDLSVSVTTYADGVTGIWTDPGCLNDSPIQAVTEELCCIPAPSGSPFSACEDSPIILNVSGSGAGILTWYTEMTGGIAIGTGSPFNAGTSSPGNYTFYVEEDNGGCTSDRVPVNVTINPLPAIMPISGNQEICDNAIGQSVTLSVSSSNPVSWSWPGGSGSGTSINVTPSVNTVYTATATNGCGSVDVVIVVSIISCCTNPDITSPADITACLSYNLPTISGIDLTTNEEYYDNSQANSGNILTGPITSTTTVWIYDGVAGCEDEESFEVTIEDPIEPSPIECWETNTLDVVNCTWSTTGTQDPTPTTECWENATFNNTSCAWDVTGTQDPTPALECWESAAFNSTSCTWDVTGTPIDISETHINVLCNGNATGSIDVTITGAVAPIVYNWNNGAFITEDLTGIPAATYTLNATDANNCPITISVNVTEETPIVIACSEVSPPTTIGGMDGIGQVNLSGGLAPYSIDWGIGSLSNLPTGITQIPNLPCGEHTVLVTDANNCETTCIFTINCAGCSLDISETHENVICNGDATGSINVTIMGATAPIVYNWNNGAFDTEDLINIPAGTYNLNAIDVNDCPISISVTITEEAPLAVTCGEVSPPNTTGGSDGIGQVDLSGGVAPYSIDWGTGSLDNLPTGTTQIPNLPCGNYTLIITDANNCETTCNFTISCSTCSITTSNIAITDCNNQGTLADNTDDTFDVTLDVQGENGGTEVTVTNNINADEWGPFSYGNITIDNLPADGMDIILTFEDTTIDGCITTITVTQTAVLIVP